jgi:N4-gp56 family major capsid protein
MAIQKYGDYAGRLNKMAGEIIGHAMHTEVLSAVGKQIEMPKNKSDTIVVRSWVPFGGTVSAPNTWAITAEQHITTEGVTPAADVIVPRDVSFTLNQYMALYSLTDRDYDLYEDDVAEAMKEQTGERMGLVREMAIFGKLKASTNKYYSGGTTRLTVSASITEKLVSNIIRTLKANHGGLITKILSPSNAYGTTSVEAAYVFYVHTDAEYDVRRLPGFREVAAYGSRQPISDYELGTWQNARFIISPELSSYTNSGAAVGSTGLKSTTGATVDVYPMIALAKEAFAQVMLRGQNAIEPIFLPPGKSDKSDPGGQRGYIGAKFWHDCEILNPGWVVVAEVGVTDLS